MNFLMPLFESFSIRFGSLRFEYDVRSKVGPDPVKKIPAFMTHLLSQGSLMHALNTRKCSIFCENTIQPKYSRKFLQEGSGQPE